MIPKESGGRAGDPNRRHEDHPAKSDRLDADSLTGHRQEDDDALFGLAGSAYGSPTYRLPDDPPPSGPERKETGQRSIWRQTDNGWKAKALAAIRELAATGQPFTADDVRHRVNDDAVSPQAWGAAVAGASRKGIIKRVAFVQSDRPERHGSFVAQWVGVR